MSYHLAVGGPVELAVYDPQGRRIVVLDTGMRPAGRHTATWNARDAGGRAIARGVYELRLSAPGYRASRQVVVMR